MLCSLNNDVCWVVLPRVYAVFVSGGLEASGVIEVGLALVFGFQLGVVCALPRHEVDL